MSDVDRRSGGIIFDIQGFTVHDGPGIRDLIFLKGCNLRCSWCCNPEGLEIRPQVLYRSSRCKKQFYGCVKACPKGAISIGQDGYIQINREKCLQCESLECTEGCVEDALVKVGRYLSVDDLMERIKKDRRSFGMDGGVTLAGGDCLTQHEFAAEILKRCKGLRIHTAIAVHGHASWQVIEALLKYTDWVFIDIKHMDPNEHKKGTGVSNTLILENIKKMMQMDGRHFVVRIPVVPGFNDSTENAIKTAEFMKGVGLNEVNLLPFHRLGSSKYEQLGMEYAFKDMKPPSSDKMTQLAECFEKYSIDCYIGSNTPF